MTFSTVEYHSSTSHVFHARACHLGLGWMSTDCHIAVLSPPEEHFLSRRKHSLLAPRCLIDRPVTIGEQPAVYNKPIARTGPHYPKLFDYLI